METIEVQGKSLDEAKRTAAEKLGVEIDRIAAEVLEESKGLFGKAVVRIRASVQEIVAKPKGRAPKAEKSPEPASEPEPKPKRVAKPKPEPAKPARAVKKAPEPTVVPSEDGEDDEVEREEVVATDEDAGDLAEIVNEILELSDLKATVKPTGLNGRYVNLELDGKDVAYIVGKHGEVLNAFQYLVNVIAARQLENGVRVTLDGNNYRRRREEALCNLAVQIAEQVRSRGEEAVLDALPAFERRIVHKALSEFDGVSTYSEGEEPNRRVVIAPEE
ncbi:MAG TPA: RNA-binding cell elongation regulator Jag/EloR [Fimbriimonadaceae bacterium]|nr:RNA-binding cell elongation regulator Jag/EloR [Fimbriimonadaceae bacterium]HRJ96249.1 RNA-binding cell elongation regulator Jag/EloR [Fimbriimonadaceae bacterium]